MLNCIFLTHKFPRENERNEMKTIKHFKQNTKWGAYTHKSQLCRLIWFSKLIFYLESIDTHGKKTLDINFAMKYNDYFAERTQTHTYNQENCSLPLVWKV